jgi:Replication-relaxation
VVGWRVELLRFVLWRLVGAVALLAGFAALAWLLSGGPGQALRGRAAGGAAGALVASLRGAGHAAWPLARPLLIGLLALTALAIVARTHDRRGRQYARLRLDTYRTDRASAEAVVAMFEALHKRLLRRWWRRLLFGQPSAALEVHHTRDGGTAHAWLAVCCERRSGAMVQAALRAAYPNCRVHDHGSRLKAPPTLLRLKKRAEFIKRVKVLDRFAHEREPPMNRLLTAMSACPGDTCVQIALTPAPASFERAAKRAYKHHEARLSRARREHLVPRDRSMVDDVELRGALDVQHRPLFFADLRVLGASGTACDGVASELRAQEAENALVQRGMRIRHALLGSYRRRLQRGEGNVIPDLRTGVYASTELAALWHVPSPDYSTVPFSRSALPLAPAPPAILRPRGAGGSLKDALGPVSIHPRLRKLNTAVPGAVEQGKTSYLVATIAEDLVRERCAVIVLDPKGDAADAALSAVPEARTCTLLDLARPTCGFNPLAVDAPADVIADYVVGALRNLFTDVDIRASSDRYLRNAIIAVLAFDRRATLWDAARLLSVGEEGYAYRRVVAAKVRELPAFKEIADFFTAELSAQLADARSMTTAKLDAPVNKLARLLNSPSIKRVLLNDSLTIDLDRVIAQHEVLVVKGALGTMGAGNTSVVMQLLVGMLDAALARQQDLVPESERVTVALKVDEAPLVLNRGFAETMALKRSAGLETVACWQTDAQWSDREIFEQLDALFAHRVYFATASARDARAAVNLTMAEFSDQVRPAITQLSALGHPDVRLHMPRHHAVASWTTPEGRQAPFTAQTIPMRVEPQRIAAHRRQQETRGGRPLTELRQPHWLRSQNASAATSAQATTPRDAPMSDPQETVREPPLPAVPAAGYSELVDLDHAQSVRWTRRAPSPLALTPDDLDWEILTLVVTFRHVLTSQLHRHLNAERSITTTQRRLKRLSDAGLLDRCQFHRRDGGGVPMCCVATEDARNLLAADGRLAPGTPNNARSGGTRAQRDSHLRQARHEVHVAGWTLALAGTVDKHRCELLGADQAVISPPARGGVAGAIGPAELRLPDGRVPHDFVRASATGTEVDVERFDTLRPDAIVRVSDQAGTDVFVERDDHFGSERWLAKLERYDHFLAGWSAHVPRYGGRSPVSAVVAFVCRDRARARECARHADAILRACRAYAGEHPLDWQYPGRERVTFVAERDVHEGLLCAQGVPRLPPSLRVEAADGDPRAAAATARPAVLLPRQALS